MRSYRNSGDTLSFCVRRRRRRRLSSICMCTTQPFGTTSTRTLTRRRRALRSFGGSWLGRQNARGVAASSGLACSYVVFSGIFVCLCVCFYYIYRQIYISEGFICYYFVDVVVPLVGTKSPSAQPLFAKRSEYIPTEQIQQQQQKTLSKAKVEALVAH